MQETNSKNQKSNGSKAKYQTSLSQAIRFSILNFRLLTGFGRVAGAEASSGVDLRRPLEGSGWAIAVDFLEDNFRSDPTALLLGLVRRGSALRTKCGLYSCRRWANLRSREFPGKYGVSRSCGAPILHHCLYRVPEWNSTKKPNS